MPPQATDNRASDRQIVYTQSLRAEMGDDSSEISDEITSFEASKLISGLIAKAHKKRGQPQRLTP